MAGEIVLGYDGSDGAKYALGAAARLAGDLGATLVPAFCFEPTPVGGEVGDYREALRELGERVIGEAGDQVRAGGIEGDPRLVEDRPAPGRARLAVELGARMIVVGSSGERPLAGAILGATPHKLLHIAETPVLVVRA